MQLASLWLYQYQLCQLLRQCLRNFKQHLIKNETYLKNSHFMNSLSLNPIQTGLFGNFSKWTFVRLGGGRAETSRSLCLLISQQLLALELSFKFV